MPRKPIEWSKCIIYKIWKDDDFYVGSTTDLASRKSEHKSRCNNEKGKKYNYKIYQTIRENGGWDVWQITPLEEYNECQSQVQARIREEEWSVKLNANLNSQKCFADSLTKEYSFQYAQEHKEELKEKNAQYYQKYKKEIFEYKKKYYQQHKEEFKKKRKEKFKCECGGKYLKQNKAQHEKTQKHQKYLTII